jgi:predicted P-loop ATPase
MLTPADIAALPPADRFMWQKLDASGLRPDDLDAVTHYDYAGNPAGFRIPYFRADGLQHPLMHRTRLSRPAPGQGKYTQPSAEEIRRAGYPESDARLPYLNHKMLGATTWQALGNVVGKKMLLVEGELKAVCAGKYLRVAAIGLPGCWGGTIKDERGIFHVNPVIQSLIQPGDTIEVVLDGDILTNKDVNRAAGTLKRALARLGIAAIFVLLPIPASGVGAGLDDWLMQQSAGDQQRAFAALPRTYGEDFYEDWASVGDYFGLMPGKSGVAQSTLLNVTTLMENHEHFTGRYFFDVLRNNLYRDGPKGPEGMTDAWGVDEVTWIHEYTGMVISRTTALDCIRWMAEQPKWRRNFLLEALPAWDNVNRMEMMFVNGWGVQDSPYIRAVGRNWLTSALARAMQPGCKVDTVLVLIGPQGIGKSKSLQALGNGFYLQTHAQVQSKDFIMAMHRGWLIDMAELSSMNHSDAAQVKGLITTDVDFFRPPYASAIAEMKRHSVIVGTTNEEHFLRDPSGNRRFWPVACGSIDLNWIKGNSLQLLAEAKTRVERGENWWDMPASTQAVQEARMETSPWDARVAVIMGSPHTMRIITVNSVPYRYITSEEILDGLDIEMRFRKSHMYRDLAASMKRVAGSWESYRYNLPITLPGGGVLPYSSGYRQPVMGNPTATVIDLPTKKF